MSKKKTKSARFKVLLSDIYRKLILEGSSHYQVSAWLKAEHDLDLVGQNEDGKPFSNYLSLYGDIKTAKATYRKMYGKKSVAENWLNDTQSAPKPRVKTATLSQDTPLEEDLSTNSVVEEPQSKPESSVRINEGFRKTKTTKKPLPDIKSLMAGFNNRL